MKTEITQKTELAQFDELKSELQKLVAPTLTIKVTDFPSSSSAIEAAKSVKGLQKRVDEKRKALVGPLNDRVSAINAYAKSITGPLLEAETYLKTQLTQFEMEQERIRREALRVAEEERRKKEAEILAKQEAERAAAAESIADESEASDLFGEDDSEPTAEQKLATLEQTQQEELSRLSQETKSREFEIRSQGIKNARKTWQCEAIDLKLVPREFLVITLNKAAILAAARGGTTEIPGVRLWQETSISIGANTYVPALEGGRK